MDGCDSRGDRCHRSLPFLYASILTATKSRGSKRLSAMLMSNKDVPKTDSVIETCSRLIAVRRTSPSMSKDLEAAYSKRCGAHAYRAAAHSEAVPLSSVNFKVIVLLIVTGTLNTPPSDCSGTSAPRTAGSVGLPAKPATTDHPQCHEACAHEFLCLFQA
jgi:hypothetical protein